MANKTRIYNISAPPSSTGLSGVTRKVKVVSLPIVLDYDNDSETRTSDVGLYQTIRARVLHFNSGGTPLLYLNQSVEMIANNTVQVYGTALGESPAGAFIEYDTDGLTILNPERGVFGEFDYFNEVIAANPVSIDSVLTMIITRADTNGVFDKIYNLS